MLSVEPSNAWRRFYNLWSLFSNRRGRVRTSSSGPLPFWLEDDTGRVLIDPEGAVMQITPSPDSGAGTMLKGGENVIYELIPEGTSIYVLGFARKMRQGRTKGSRLREKLKNLKSDPDRMNSYDSNQDGVIDEIEWEEARRDAERRLLAESLKPGTSAAEETVIGKSPRGYPFIIADSREKLLQKRLAKQFLTYFILGLAAMGIGAALILTTVLGAK